VAVIHGDTKGGNMIKVKAKFDFKCVPYFMPELRREWKKEREYRIAEVSRIDGEIGNA
jgi:hypothetical protein